MDIGAGKDLNQLVEHFLDEGDAFGAGIEQIGEDAPAVARLGPVAENAELGVSCDERLRVAGLACSRDGAETINDEVEALYTNGPAGGGGVRTRLVDVVGIVSTLVERSAVRSETTILEA